MPALTIKGVRQISNNVFWISFSFPSHPRGQGTLGIKFSLIQKDFAFFFASRVWYMTTMSESYTLTSDEWWVMSDEWWVMNDKWWMMSDWWRAMSDEWWVMSNDDRVCWCCLLFICVVYSLYLFFSTRVCCILFVVRTFLLGLIFSKPDKLRNRKVTYKG